MFWGGFPARGVPSVFYKQPPESACMAEPRRLDRRAFGIAVGSLTTVAVAGCLGDDDGDGGDEPDVMAGTDDSPLAFVPDEITVSVGDTVTWEWGTDNHNIAVRDQPDGADWPGEPETHNSGHTYSYTFEVAGTYEYVCEPHEANGMEGTVIVEE